jgi:hypothetical protein
MSSTPPSGKNRRVATMPEPYPLSASHTVRGPSGEDFVTFAIRRITNSFLLKWEKKVGIANVTWFNVM